MADPLTIAALGSGFFGGLFGGGQEEGRSDEERFFSGKLLQEQRRAQALQNRFAGLSEGGRLESLGLQNQLAGLGLQRGQFGLETAGQLRGSLFDFLGQNQQFDVSGAIRGLQGQFGNQSRSLQSNFARRGFGGTGAEAGALGNLFAQQVAIPGAQLQQQAFNQFQNQNLGVLGLLGGLTR